jgi:hypothetical protein
MTTIPTNQARGPFTNFYLAKYKEQVPAKTFLQSFFKVIIANSLLISLEVLRSFEKIAVDILRGETGDRVQWTKSTEKNFLPPYFKREFDQQALENYDRVFGESEDVNSINMIALANETAEKFSDIRDTITRRIELYCAQIFETGVMSLNAMTDIDFKRKAGSMVDNSADNWSDPTADIEQQYIDAAIFLREKGKTTTGLFNTKMRNAEFVNFKKSNFFKDNANFQNVQLVDIKTPQANAVGGVYHGRFSAGSWLFDLWTYEEGYENEALTFIHYIADKKVITTPSTGTRFELTFAAVPQKFKDSDGQSRIVNMSGDFLIDDYINDDDLTHNFRTQSAPCPIPVTVDQIYTMQVET